MANSYVDILRLVEAHIPQAVGGGNFDDRLRLSLVPFANTTMDEIDRLQRWSLSYAEPFFTTANGTEQYALPYPSPAGPLGMTTNTFIKRVYYVNSTGKPVILERMDQQEIQRVYGESLGLGASATAPPVGQPVKYAIIPSTSTLGGIDQGNPQLTMFLYPVPDSNGPETSGNYKIRVAGYWKTPPIVETLAGSSTSATLTFTTAGSGNYLIANGVPSNGSNYNLFVALRNGGNPTGLGSGSLVIDTHISSWTAIAANTATLSTASPANSSAQQCFFNGTNWIIQHWPKILIFGMMREVANYFGKQDLFMLWDGKFKEQVEALRTYEFDRSRGLEMFAAVQTGQKASALRRNDLDSFLDYRGGTNG